MLLQTRFHGVFTWLDSIGSLMNFNISSIPNEKKKVSHTGLEKHEGE